MVEPNSLTQQIEADDFRADVCLAVVVSVETFNNVQNNSTIQQETSPLFQDYDQANKDAASIIELLQQFGIEGRKTKIYDLKLSLTEAKIFEMYQEIERQIQEGKKATPVKRYLVFWIFCGRFIKA